MIESQLYLFTIGHSRHPVDVFIELLKRHGVTAVADVRSAPFSKFNPQFNKEALARDLAAQGIRYVFLGRELGARSADRSLYQGGRVRYDRLAETTLFKEGITRVMQGAAEHRVALMCAEKEPLDCHRTLLVSRVLQEQGVEVSHILHDGRLETHSEAMNRLLDMCGIPRNDLFRSHADLLAEALAQQEAKVAYVDPSLAAEETA